MGLQWLAKGKDSPQGSVVKMNSNIATGYNLPPDPGGEFTIYDIFRYTGYDIYNLL
jgi:hypothetical protein